MGWGVSQQERNKRSAEQKGWLGEGESVAGSISIAFSKETTQPTRKSLQVQGQWGSFREQKKTADWVTMESCVA